MLICLTSYQCSVIIIAQQYQAQVWTIDYKDLSFFGNVQFWNPQS